MSFRRATRTSQPQQWVPVDWSNPITRGLRYASPQGAQSYLTTTGPSKVVNTAGVADKFSTTQRVDVLDSSVGRSSDLTVLVMHRSTVLPPNSGTFSHILYASTGSASSDYFGSILMLGNGTGFPQWRTYQSTSGSADGSADATSGALNDGKVHLTIGRVVGAGGGLIDLWVDGKRVANSAHTVARSTFTSTGSSFGKARDSFWGGLDGEIGLVAVWHRTLTDAEIASISANPWQLFAPVGSPILVPSQSSGTPTGTLAKTNANDTATASGTQTNTGSLARTNANDTASATGAQTNTGSLAKTNASDSVSAAGAQTNTGTLARTNANDTSAATGAAGSTSGTASITNLADSVQALGTAATGAAGGYDDKPKKRRFIQRVGDKLVIFDNPAAAIRALEGNDKPTPEAVQNAPEQAPEAKPEPEAPQPVEIDLAALRAQAEMYQQQQRLMQMFEQRNYEQMVALYESLLQQQDDDEIELLLMAM